MLVGIMGKMGTGKTLSQTILMTYLHHVTKVPIAANYTINLPDASVVTNLMEIEKKTSEVFGFDEIWLSADARTWADNVKLTQWVNQTRKKKMIIFYTTQHIRQVEMRIRNATDVLVVCEKDAQGHWLTFIDWQYKTIGRRYLIPHSVARLFYPLYDTYEVLKPLTWGNEAYKGITREYDNVRNNWPRKK